MTDNQELWKRAQFEPRLRQLQELIKYYKDYTFDTDLFTFAVKRWTVEVEVRPWDPELGNKLRQEWIEKGDIDVFRKYSELGMSQRDMGKAVNVSASSISRWLSGQRTRRTD